MNLCTLIGHKYVAHPAGYHFCQRCGGSDVNPKLLVDAMAFRNFHHRTEERGPIVPRPSITTGMLEKAMRDCSAKAAEQLVEAIRRKIKQKSESRSELSSDGGDLGGPASDESRSSTSARSAVATTEPGETPDIQPSDGHSKAQPAGGGGGEGNTLDVDEIRYRLKAYFERTGKTPWSGAFSVSDGTVHNILTGKTNGSPATLKKLREELDAYTFADETPDGEVGPHVPPVEEVPNSLPDVTGLNPIPKPSAPPRHARTP